MREDSLNCFSDTKAYAHPAGRRDLPATAEAVAFYVKRGQEARRFIQQRELYLIKAQKAHFTDIEM